MSIQLIISLVVLGLLLAYVVVRFRHPVVAYTLPEKAGSETADSGMDPEFTDWEKNLAGVLQRIPKGRVITFTTLSSLLGKDVSVVAVGNLIRKYSQEGKLPWWRVVRRDGQRGLVSASNTGKKQRQLLIREGVKFNEGTFIMADFEWKNPKA